MRKKTLGRLAGLGLIPLLSAPAHAATFTDDAFFTAQDRSIWAGGAGFTFDTGQRFIGTSWDIGKTIGGIDETCVFGICASFGAEIGAKTSGKLGVDYSLKVNSGTFDIQLPGRATFTTPSSSPTQQVQTLTIGSSFTTLAGGLAVPTTPNGAAVVRLPSLQVTGPTAQATLGLEASVSAFAGAKACVVVCYGPALGPLGFDYSQSIASVNVNNDHQVTVLGTTVSANQSVSALGGLLNASFDIPNLDSSSQTTPGGFNGTTLTSTKRDNIASVNANIAQIAADAIGFPFPLAGNLGPFGYNLLQANAGTALDVQQTISVTPKVSGTYLFSSPVIPVVNGVDGALTSQIDFNFGDNVTFRPGDVSKLSYLPIINLDGVVHNETDLVVGGNLDVKALGVNIAGLSLGPLIDTTLASSDLGRISLFDSTFTERLSSITASPITFDLSGCQTGNYGVPEFPSYGVCASSVYDSIGPFDNGDGSFYDIVDNNVCLEQAPGGRLPLCIELSPGLVTSPYIPDGRRTTYLSGADSLTYQPIATTPSTTDATQLASLAALGYTGPPLGSADPFVIPVGASLESFDVGEPPPLAILVLPTLAILAFSRRRGPAMGS